MGNIKYYTVVFFLLIFILVFAIHLNSTGKVVGSVNVTIYTLASLNFTIKSVDFGLGSVYRNSSSAVIDTTGNVVGGNWTPINNGFIVENIGNTNLSVFLKSGKNAVEFLGGTSPGYYYMFNNFEANSCTENATAMNSWFALNNSGLGDELCENMQYGQDEDSIRIDLRLIVPADAIRGEREDILTVTGTSS